MYYNVKDLDLKYTEVVKEYLDMGYTFYSPESSGSQGATISTLLTDGKRVVAIYMDDVYSSWEDHLYDKRVIIAGVAKNYIPYKTRRTIWLNEIEAVKEYTFYQTNYHRGYYTDDIEVAKSCYELNLQRAVNRQLYGKIYTDKKRLDIAYKICKKTKGYKSVTKKDIRDITKNNGSYTISFYDNKFNHLRLNNF